MKIGIDVDDTIVMTLIPMVKYANKYSREVLGRDGIVGNFGLIQNRYYLEALYGWNAKEKYGFFDMYYKNVLEECEMIQDVDKVCQKLKKEKNLIYFITARMTNIKNCNSEEITKKTLVNNNIPYDKLIFDASNKLDVCKKEGIDLLIEDSYETCKELLDNGIKSILVTTKMNERINSNDVPRVHNWNEVYDQVMKMNSQESLV